MNKISSNKRKYQPHSSFSLFIRTFLATFILTYFQLFYQIPMTHANNEEAKKICEKIEKKLLEGNNLSSDEIEQLDSYCLRIHGMIGISFAFHPCIFYEKQSLCFQILEELETQSNETHY